MGDGRCGTEGLELAVGEEEVVDVWVGEGRIWI